jgi:hypothetical protein
LTIPNDGIIKIGNAAQEEFKSSVVIRHSSFGSSGGRIAGRIKPSQAAAILAFSAAMGIA